MLRNTFNVKSITYAIKGRDLLRKHGIKAFVERKTDINGNNGCGYVIVAFGDKRKISEILFYSDIKILGSNPNV